VSSENKIQLGFSTCPNDTFMFGSLVQGLTAYNPSDFDLIMKDIEVLNTMAGNHQTSISKISFASYPFIADAYQILNSGSALGYKNGPILVSRYKIYPDEVKDLHVAIPGKLTTANLLLEILFPEVKQKTAFLFSDIEDAVMDKACDAGLIIHENRFTYRKKGLLQIADLGEMWEKEFDLPVPLGGIVIKRNMEDKQKKEFEKALADSIRMAFKDPKPIWAFIKKNARELDDGVIQAHIDLYVNEFSIDLGEKGKQAIRMLFQKGEERGILPGIPGNIFVE
jgi:1,4-dihydroxy-6-naphthoate synthase